MESEELRVCTVERCSGSLVQWVGVEPWTQDRWEAVVMVQAKLNQNESVVLTERVRDTSE